MKNIICFFDKKQDGFTELDLVEETDEVDDRDRWQCWFLRLIRVDRFLPLCDTDREVDSSFKFEENMNGLIISMKQRIKSDELRKKFRESWFESFALVIVYDFVYSQYKSSMKTSCLH